MIRRPIGIQLLVVFFGLATVICAATALTIVVPGTAVDVIWRLKPEGRADLVRGGLWMAVFFALLSIPMATAAIGLFRRRPWGWWTAVSIFAVNALADSAHGAIASNWHDFAGLPVVALLVWYLCQRRVRKEFASRAPDPVNPDPVSRGPSPVAPRPSTASR